MPYQNRPRRRGGLGRAGAHGERFSGEVLIDKFIYGRWEVMVGGACAEFVFQGFSLNEALAPERDGGDLPYEPLARVPFQEGLPLLP